MKYFLIFIFNLFYLFAFPQASYHSHIIKAESFYAGKNYTSALKSYQSAFEVQTGLPADLYNAACCAALTGNNQEAFSLISKALDKGWTNVSHLKKDPDLITLHETKQWNKLVKKMQDRLDKVEAHYDKPLQKELLEILDRDQKVRNEYLKAFDSLGNTHRTTDSLASRVMFEDSLNLIKVTKILDREGWVSKSKVGDQAPVALFLVIQHSDLKIQEKYYSLMKKAVADGELKARYFALLEDRILLRNGHRQKYGSQIYYNNKTGKYYVAPLEDPDKVDERRLQVDLGPLSEYVKKWKIDWNAATYKAELPELEKLGFVK